MVWELSCSPAGTRFWTHFEHFPEQKSAKKVNRRLSNKSAFFARITFKKQALSLPVRKRRTGKCSKNEPYIVSFGGGQMRENRMNSKGFGAFPVLRGVHLGPHFRDTFRVTSGPPNSRIN